MYSIPQFGILTDGDRERLQALVDNGTITYPGYFFDDKTHHLLFINKDKKIDPIVCDKAPQWGEF